MDAMNPTNSSMPSDLNLPVAEGSDLYGMCLSANEPLGDFMGNVYQFGTHYAALHSGPFAPVAEFAVVQYDLDNKIGDAVDYVVTENWHHVCDLGQSIVDTTVETANSLANAYDNFVDAGGEVIFNTQEYVGDSIKSVNEFVDVQADKFSDAYDNFVDAGGDAIYQAIEHKNELFNSMNDVYDNMKTEVYDTVKESIFSSSSNNHQEASTPSWATESPSFESPSWDTGSSSAPSFSDSSPTDSGSTSSSSSSDGM